MLREGNTVIVFIGQQIRGKWMEEVTGRLMEGEEFSFIPESAKIGNHVNPILAHPCSYMIFDVEQYVDEAGVLADQILRIHQVNNAKTIIYAPGYSPTSRVITALLEKQFKNFILSTGLSDQKDELEKCLNGYFDKHSVSEFGYVEPVLEEEEFKNHLNFKNIGIAGANARIGTTTQAIQIIKYLMLCGYRAAYIEMNDHQWVKELKEWYEVQTDEESGKVTYCSVDLFYDQLKLKGVLKQGYDYYVYDFGVYSEPDFNKISFLEKDYQIFVCGCNPDEMRRACHLLKNSFYDDALYLYSFVPEADQKELSQLMEEKRRKTFFVPYTPDPFVYCNADIYKNMIPVENRNIPEKNNNRWFWNLKNHRKKRQDGKV